MLVVCSGCEVSNGSICHHVLHAVFKRTALEAPPPHQPSTFPHPPELGWVFWLGFPSFHQPLTRGGWPSERTKERCGVSTTRCFLTTSKTNQAPFLPHRQSANPLFLDVFELTHRSAHRLQMIAVRQNRLNDFKLQHRNQELTDGLPRTHFCQIHDPRR